MLDKNFYQNSIESLSNYEWKNKNFHYLNRYIQFIITRKNIKIQTKTAKHHIFPKSMGGKDIANNLIYLTHREHFIAHYMLAKAFPKHPIVHALARMTKTQSIKDSKLYTLSIELYKEKQRLRLHGRSLFEGRHFSEETKKIFSLKNLGENNPQSKLKKQDIIDIVKLYYIDKLTQLEISKLFSVVKSTIKGILLGYVWTSVTNFNKVSDNKLNYQLAIKLLKENNKI